MLGRNLLVRSDVIVDEGCALTVAGRRRHRRLADDTPGDDAA